MPWACGRAESACEREGSAASCCWRLIAVEEEGRWDMLGVLCGVRGCGVCCWLGAGTGNDGDEVDRLARGSSSASSCVE